MTDHPRLSAESCDLNEEDILPCPFCGKPPFVEQTGFHLGGRTIRCETDDCMGPHTTAVCINDAVVQWNRRIPDAAQGWRRPLATISEEEIEGVAQAIERSMFAPHELPLSADLHLKYRATAISAINAAAQPPAAPVHQEDAYAASAEAYNAAHFPSSAGNVHELPGHDETMTNLDALKVRR